MFQLCMEECSQGYRVVQLHVSGENIGDISSNLLFNGVSRLFLGVGTII